jgi:hypothetical protein
MRAKHVLVEAVTQSRFGNAAAHSRKCHARRTMPDNLATDARARRPGRPFFEPTLRSDLTGSPGVCARASVLSSDEFGHGDGYARARKQAPRRAVGAE